MASVVIGMSDKGKILLELQINEEGVDFIFAWGQSEYLLLYNESNQSSCLDEDW